MKVAAVVGARSMLGRQLVKRLAAAGVPVMSVGREAGADIQLDLESGWRVPVPVDARADVLFHCASSFADDSREGIRKNFQVNTAGCLWVLELAEHLSCEAIVYAGSLSSLETLEPGKYSSYGLSKAQGEAWLAWGMTRRERRFCSLRFPQLYDTDGDCIRHQPWFGRIVAYASRGLDLRMPRSAGARNFLHLDDAVGMMLAAARVPVDGVLDIVHPESLTYEEIARVAYETFGQGGRVVVDAAKQPFRPIHFPDGAAAFSVLGLMPSISIAEGIARIRDQATWAAFGPMDVS
jgi:nucleoside-diphosphate-sugar epimerase